jgi:putative transposase
MNGFVLSLVYWKGRRWRRSVGSRRPWREATKPAARNYLQQQARFDKFIYQDLPDIDYPFHDRTIVVTHCGRICLSFMDYDLGYFDLETRVLEPLENPFGPKCYPCSRYEL